MLGDPTIRVPVSSENRCTARKPHKSGHLFKTRQKMPRHTFAMPAKVAAAKQATYTAVQSYMQPSGTGPPGDTERERKEKSATCVSNQSVLVIQRETCQPDKVDSPLVARVKPVAGRAVRGVGRQAAAAAKGALAARSKELGVHEIATYAAITSVRPAPVAAAAVLGTGMATPGYQCESRATGATDPGRVGAAAAAVIDEARRSAVAVVLAAAIRRVRGAVILVRDALSCSHR